MVNIQSIVHITNSGHHAFNSFPEYWNYALARSSPRHREKLKKFKQVSDLFSDGIAEKYGYKKEQTKNVSFLFGRLSQGNKKLEDVFIRELVFSLEHQIILEIKETDYGTHVVVTVHRENDFEILSTIVTRPVEIKPQSEQ